MSDTDENAETLPSTDGEQTETEKEKIAEEKEHDSGGEEPSSVEEGHGDQSRGEEGDTTGGETEPEQYEEDEVCELNGDEEAEEEKLNEEEPEEKLNEEEPEEKIEIEEKKEETVEKPEDEESEEEEDELEIEVEVEQVKEESESVTEESEPMDDDELFLGADEEQVIGITEDEGQEKDVVEPVDDEAGHRREEEEEETGPEQEHYDADDFISGPSLSDIGSIPIDILEFFHSFGYNCRKKFNLEVLDENTVIFVSGNYLNFFNLETKELKFRRTALGGGIGHIKKNPNREYKHFAIAECGKKPVIILYTWPEMEIECLLRGGAKRLYSNLDYSPDGEFLVSQSGDPDYMITVWNWKEHTILLRNKSYINDVFQVKFSPYLAGQITTCGVAHIKFWKMASTFTGIKLQGELGRFGKTEYSDIIGCLPMPDEKVVSGCDWGNMLIWDGGLIVLEVFRSGRKKCHEGPIVQIFYEEGELWTISLDGHVRIWWYEKIDQADPSDDDPVILLDPSYDFYTPGMSLVSIVKRTPEGSLFVAQDGNGGIWQIDLNTEEEPTKSIQYYKCHAGKVVDIATCPYGPYLISFGKDGRFYVYNYLTKRLIYRYEQMTVRGSRFIWPHPEQVRTSDVLIAAFLDGQLRVFHLKLPSSPENEDEIEITLTQVIKPHNKPVTDIVMNVPGDIVVSGSEDATIFIFKVNNDDLNDFLIPIGFLPAPDAITYMTWHPTELCTILIGCLHGQMMEVELPTECIEDTTVSYELKTLKPKYRNFFSYKSQIRRDIYLEKVARRKEKKRERKYAKMLQMLKDNPGMEIDEDVFLADSEPDERLEPLYIPEPKNRILWMMYTPDDTIWVSMAGYDAGYIYEYLMDQKLDEPYRFKMVADADDIEINGYLYDSQRKFLIFAMQDGCIRINRVNNDWRDLSDYWICSMHDNQYGFVPRMRFSYDQKFFFSCGHDGNIFGSHFNPEVPEVPCYVLPETRESPVMKVPDVDSDTKLSMEETKIKVEQDRIAKSANAHKAKVREILKELRERFLRLLNRNNKLLPSQIIPRNELEPDQRVLEYIDENFRNKVEVIKKKMAYELQKSEIQMKKLLKYFTDPADKHPITIQGLNDSKLYLMTVRQRVMSPMFNEMLKICIEKIEEEKIRGRPVERAREPPKAGPVKAAKAVTLEYFLLSLSPSQIEKRLGPKLTRMLQKYRSRRDKWEKRQDEWEDFMSKKPNPDKNHPDDEKFLAEAVLNIGDYKLKEAPDYKAPPEIRDTTVKKYKQVLDTRLRQYNLRHGFIQKVYDIRTLKYQVRDKLVEQRNLLYEISKELPSHLHKNGPPVPERNLDEFPEEKLTPNIILPDPEESENEAEFYYPFVQAPSLEEKRSQMLPDRGHFPKLNQDGVFSSIFYTPKDIAAAVDAEMHELIENYPEDKDTPFESDVRTKRLTRLVFIQKCTIHEMEREIQEFNEKIEEAKDIRLPIHVRGNFIDLYILTLNQELNILKRLEPGENALLNKVHKCLKLVHSLEDDMDVEKNKKMEIETLLETNHIEEMKIQEKFKHAAENNKFFDFLKRVFRKKYRPPKITTDSESESESSSSSEEESEVEDTASVDSADFGFIKQDLNVCPKGCELAIFNLTVELRRQRHEIEQHNRELFRQIETINKNIDLGNRKLRILTNQYDVSAAELEVYQKERQDLLNQVKCTVCLNLDQIYDYNPETDEIPEYLVFSKSILSELYKRVGILEYENLQQKAKYETYLKHLTRMKKDLGYMRVKMKRLLRQIQTMMSEKFGKNIELKELEQTVIKKQFNKSHINELEEVVLKKLVYEIRIKNTNLKEVYGTQLTNMNQQIRDSQETLIRHIRENTNRLELLQVMNKEKKELVKVISSQSKRRGKLEKVLQTTSEYHKDIKKLEAIVENQNRTMFELKAEIKMLKTKGMPPKEKYKPPVVTKDSTFKEEVCICSDYTKRDKEMLEALEEQEKELIEKDSKEWPAQIEKYLEKQASETETEEESQAIKEKPLQESEETGFFLTESEDVVTSLLNELISGLKPKSQSEIDVGLIIRKILSKLMTCVTVNEIIKEIVCNIPFDLSDKQRGLVEHSAERLYQIQEPDMSEDSVIRYARDLLEDTIDEVLLYKGNPYEVLAKLITKLVESVPKEFLLHEASVESIVEKVTSYVETYEIEKEPLVEKIRTTASVYKADILEILNIILERVYGTGLDYMYIIKKR